MTLYEKGKILDLFDDSRKGNYVEPQRIVAKEDIFNCGLPLHLVTQDEKKSLFKESHSLINTGRIIVGFLHTSFWLGLGLVIYIFIALLFPSGTKTVEYMGKTYVKQYGLFGTVSYHERINPIMVKSLSVDYELQEAIRESEYRYEK